MAGELLLSTLRHVLATLASLNVDFALMGGIAVAAWRHLRNTRDIDLLVGIVPADVTTLVEQFQRAGFKLLRDPPLLALGNSKILQLTYEPPGRFLDVRIDLFLADSEIYRSALARRREMAVAGLDQPAFVLSCEDLILTKLFAGRLIDRSDAAYLLRFNREELDLEYVRRWSVQMSLEKPLEEIWQEAFPGDQPPT